MVEIQAETPASSIFIDLQTWRTNQKVHGQNKIYDMDISHGYGSPLKKWFICDIKSRMQRAIEISNKFWYTEHRSMFLQPVPQYLLF